MLKLGESSDKDENLDTPLSSQSRETADATEDTESQYETPILGDSAHKRPATDVKPTVRSPRADADNHTRNGQEQPAPVDDIIPVTPIRETPERMPRASKKSRKKEKIQKSRKNKSLIEAGVPAALQGDSPLATTPDVQVIQTESPILETPLQQPPLEPSDNEQQEDSCSSTPDIVSILASKGNGQGKKVGIISPKPVDINGMIERILSTRNDRMSKVCKMKNSEIFSICARAREILLQQPILLELNPPVRIVGDIHGQFKDLLRFFDMCGYPPTANYLFLGDYVDRGKQSLETILLLLCYKIKYPENIFILRGNHECASVNRVYGFYDECKRKCNLKVWRAFTDLFNCLPVTAIVGGASHGKLLLKIKYANIILPLLTKGKIFCVHGGLSPGLASMDDILKIQRPLNVPDFGLLNDLLWSDPSETAVTWEGNERGVSYCFSKQILTGFLERHKFDLVCRAHMVVQDGYEFFNNRSLVTIFSAPNYCGEFDNRG